MLFGLLIVVVALIILLIVRLARGKRRSAMRLHDIGTIIDRSISAYRRNVLFALIVSALCFPLGTISNFSASILTNIVLFIIPSNVLTITRTPWLLLVLPVFGAIGIGKTILACGIASGLRAQQQEEPANLGAFVPRRRIGAVIGLSLLMLIPSLLMTFLGWVGGLIGLFWSLAPVVMIQEGIGPYAATKRSYKLVRENYSSLLNTIVPLWLIGWLIVGTPLVASIWLLRQLVIADEYVLTVVALCGWAIGQICVAPLTAFGAATFYRFVQERVAQVESLESQIANVQPGESLPLGG